MSAREKKLGAYNEARYFCEMYINYVGDKRKSNYIRLQNSCINVWIPRLNNFANELNLLNFYQLYNN